MDTGRDRERDSRGRRQRLGQHFLAAGGAVTQVVEAIAPRRGERFFEVGPGRGAITWPLLEAGVRLLAVEIDPALVRRLRQIPEASAEFTVVRGDILTVDLPDLLDRELPPGRGIRAVGNLPYSVATPAILRLLSLPERFTDLTLMVQMEVADRILSPPGTRDYGVLTLLCAGRAVPERLLDLPPGCFQPPPEVHSTLLRFTPRPPLFPSGEGFATFAAVVKAAFSSRRKRIRNSLSGGAGLPVAQAEAWLKSAGVDPTARPEEIPLEGYLELARHVPERPRGPLPRPRATGD
jgi:16S rRNA (adenine1518-N6/adenine1519-N6)-dimethyltransferase